MKDLKCQYGIKCINSLCVQINGVERKDLARVNNKTVLYIRNDDLLKYRILDEKDREEFFRILSEDSFVEDFYCFGFDGFMGDLSYESYQKQVKLSCEKFRLSLDGDSRIVDYIRPIHLVRSSEIEVFYQYTDSIVLNGEEWKGEWGDGAFKDAWKEPTGTLMPDYISIDQAKDIQGIPADEIIHREVGDPRDYHISFDYIPKKYLDKLILYRRYLDFSNIENSLRRNYNGKIDRWVLDFNNPNSQVFDFMINYGVFEKLR